MSTALATQQHSVSPMDLIQKASEAGATIEQMQQLFDLKLRVDADDAKRAFNEAFTAFKAEPIRIVRDKENTQYSKGDRKAMYTSLENMVSTVTPYLSKHGLAHSWSTPQQTDKSVTVACTITHVQGHSVTETVTGPLDESGAKNKLQQVKSTMTYLKVATFESVCGLASAFGSTNDDGNSAGSKEIYAPEDEMVGFIGDINGCSSIEETVKVFQLAYKYVSENYGDKNALAELQDAKNKRKTELQKAGA